MTDKISWRDAAAKEGRASLDALRPDVQALFEKASEMLEGVAPGNRTRADSAIEDVRGQAERGLQIIDDVLGQLGGA